MKLRNPLHDRCGVLWPEYDARPVTSSVFAQYQDCCRADVWNRTQAGLFGPVVEVFSLACSSAMRKGAGVLLVRAHKTSRGYYVYLPAVIYRTKGLGRYADPHFNPDRQRELYDCALTDTFARRDAAVTGVPQAVQERLTSALLAIAGLTQALMQPVIPGPRGDNVIPFTSALEG